MSQLTPFGFTGDGDDSRWKAAVDKLLTALITNPHLNVGERNSEIVFPTTFQPKKRAGTATVAGGAFFTLFVNDDGDTMLQGGGVTGGNGGSETIADYKVIDSGTGPVHTPGTILYLQASCEATVSDGVMQPGCLLNSASLTTGGSVPANHTFTKSSKTGNIYTEIGRWTADTFLPSAPGNILASGCIGNFSLSR